jgi:hypothetical protein
MPSPPRVVITVGAGAGAGAGVGAGVGAGASVGAGADAASSRTEADRQAAESLTAGFGREGIPVVVRSTIAALVDDVKPDDLVLISAGFEDQGQDGVAAVAAVRARHGAAPVPERGRPAIIVLGDAERRGAALAAGANAFAAKPAFVKDVVTLARVLSMPKPDADPPRWAGELEGLHLYYIVRALAAAGMTGILTLHRGMRRGELRFFEGELTSAQVGALHGQAAFHHLLLWPDAGFDLRAESVVRRQQIPLTPAELQKDAERFLRDFHELSDGLSPASIYEADAAKAAEHAAEIPPAAQPVLRLFDGARSLADVIEESEVGLAETVRDASRLVGLGVLRKAAVRRSPGDAAAALAIEDWLVGQAPPAAPKEPRPRRPKGETPPRGEKAADWGSLGLVAAWDAPGYAPVVPSMTQTGEIRAESPPIRSKIVAGNDEGGEAKTVGQNGKKPHGEGKRVGSSTGSRAAAAAVAVAEPVVAESPAPAPAPAAKPASARMAVVREPPKAFDDHEEAFFAAESPHFDAPTPDSFADLDEGKPKLSFWQRLFHKTPDPFLDTGPKKKRKPKRK